MFIFRQKSACGSFFVDAFAPWNDLDCIILTDEEKLELVVGWILTSCQRLQLNTHTPYVCGFA